MIYLTCYLNIFPEEKSVSSGVFVYQKRQTKIYDHPNCPFQSPSKFRRESNVIKELIFILDFRFKLVLPFSFTNIDCGRLGGD